MRATLSKALNSRVKSGELVVIRTLVALHSDPPDSEQRAVIPEVVH